MSNIYQDAIGIVRDKDNLLRKILDELAKAQAENEALREQNLAMNKTIARMQPVVVQAQKHARGEINKLFDAVHDYETTKEALTMNDKLGLSTGSEDSATYIARLDIRIAELERELDNLKAYAKVKAYNEAIREQNVSKEALALYKAPFYYDDEAVYDSNTKLVTGIGTDKVGRLIAEALTEYWMKHAP